MEANVCHPIHYNSHPSGIECIDIIRNYVCDIANAMKYLWRAGLKSEAGMTGKEKEIEDLQKAVWYLRDFLSMKLRANAPCDIDWFFLINGKPIGCVDITRHYDLSIGKAIEAIWCVGVISESRVCIPLGWKGRIDTAITHIEKRIKTLSN